MAAELALARAAAENVIPLFMSAPAAGRPLLIVRALHALAHRAGPVLLCPLTGFVPEAVTEGTTLVFALEPVDLTGLPLLEALLDEPPAWIVVVCEPPTTLPGSLRARLRAAALHLPPVIGRGEELAILATGVLQALAARSGRPPASLTRDAVEALGVHGWPGGRLELEAVLGRALLLAGPGGRIDATLLDFDGAAEPTTEATGASDDARDAAGPRLAYLLAELAHELRNPLVTIKTFAQQLPALLADEALRTRFAELTDDAIERMDALLENVLDFARLPRPHLQDVDVATVLDQVLGVIGPTLAQREVHVRRVGAGAHCEADPQHLGYALGNLLIGIAHETPPRAEVVIDASVNGVVSLRFGTGATITRLRELAAVTSTASLDDPTFLPLAFTLARAVLERTGAHLAVAPDHGGQAMVTVRLPPAGSGRDRNER
jgi:signal transduction histidine kinase